MGETTLVWEKEVREDGLRKIKRRRRLSLVSQKKNWSHSRRDHKEELEKERAMSLHS